MSDNRPTAAEATGAVPRIKPHTETFHGEFFFRNDLLIHVNRVPESFAAPEHDHDFLEFTYIAEGTGYHHVGGEVAPVRKGQLFFFPLGVSHVFRPPSADSSKQPLIVYNCLVHPSVLARVSAFASDPDVRRYIGSVADGAEGYFTRPDAGEGIEQLFQSLHREYALALQGAPDCLHALLLQLLVALFRLKRRIGAPSQSTGVLEAFSAVLDYVDAHLAEELTLARLARASRWSERQLQRLFRRHAEQSFHRYLQQRRMQKSCALLRGTQLSVAAVAERAGYRDVGSFLSVFKRTTGLTPSRYRQSQAGTPSVADGFVDRF